MINTVANKPAFGVIPGLTVIRKSPGASREATQNAFDNLAEKAADFLTVGGKQKIFYHSPDGIAVIENGAVRAYNKIKNQAPGNLIEALAKEAGKIIYISA